MSTLNDDDLLLVERGGVLYKVEAQYISTGTTGIILPPVEVLTPVDGAGVTRSDWDQSQVWSSGSYSGTAASNNYGVTDLFGGVGADGGPFAAGTLWGLYQATGTFTLSNPIPISSGDTLELITYQSSSSAGSITFESSNGSVSPSLTVGGTNELGSTTIADPYSTFGSQITAITIAASGGDWTGLAAIILNGKMLVDSTVDPQVAGLGPSEVTFTSQNQGTPAFSGVDATLASRTWTLESGTTATGPWTLVDTYVDYGVLSTQTGATPWTENKPTLQPNTFYRIKVQYDSTNATSVESEYNTFKTGDA
tara:strand:- start:4283 stop:5209 length:927 start_codon:yes stop_codon:yes gene_type:complete